MREVASASDARKLHGWTPLRQRLVLIASSLALDAEDGEESISLLRVASGPNQLADKTARRQRLAATCRS